MGPCFFLWEHLFGLSHMKIRWTMSVDHVRLKRCLFGTSNSMVTLTFLVGVTEVVMRQVRQPITCFAMPWDDVTVYGVHNP